MKTQNQDVHGTFGLLLGLTSAWEVSDVDLDLSAEKVSIYVNYRTKEAECPKCKKKCKIKDHREERSWRHLDTMQFETLVKCRVPRSDCPEHGIKTMEVPWATGRSNFTLLFERFSIKILQGAKSIKQAQKILRISWDQSQRIMERAVDRGLSRRNIEDLCYVGIDEKSFGRGHDYISLLSDINGARVLDVERGRDQKSADLLWKKIPEEQRANIQAVALDMWDAFMSSTKENVPSADLVHDKFHVAKYLGKSVDNVRKKENRELIKEGDETLKGSKYVWLTNPLNWKESHHFIFNNIKKISLKTSRAWAIKESFGAFWSYIYPKPAEKYFKKWYYWATHSQLKPIIETAKTLKRHLKGLMTYFKHKITNAVTEGLNSKIQSIKANARGFRNFEHYRVSILFHCGKLEMNP